MKNLFKHNKPIIACIHLMALPGSPLYAGNMTAIYDKALEELDIFKHSGVDGIIIENFRDKPFYPDKVPAETIAAMAGIGREIVKQTNMPVGINILRNDAEGALAIATAIEAHFIRVTSHLATVVSEQGLIYGTSYKTLRLRKALDSQVFIFADVDVKHTVPLAPLGLDINTQALCQHGLVDAVIVSGKATGIEVNYKDLEIVKQNSSVPVFIGSGVTPDNINKISDLADGFIIGSYFKQQGKANNAVEASRVINLITVRNSKVI